MNDHTNSVFSQNKDIIKTLLSENEQIGIVISDRHSIDNIGASLSLYLSLSALSKNVQVISKTDPLIEYSYLVGVDKIKKSFDGLTKTLTISVPYREGEIEKVSYNEEGDRLNLNLFGSESGITFLDSDIRFIRKGSTPSLIIAIGIDKFSSLQALAGLDKSVRVINIDRSVHNEFYGDVIFVDPSFSSFSEIVSKIIEDNLLPIDIDIAQNLLDGINFATNNFNSPTTSMHAFESAAILMRNGARRKTQETRGQIKNVEFNRKPFKTPLPSRSPFNATDQLVTTPVVDDAFSPLPKDLAPKTDEIPSDWLAPKVFKGSKNQQ